MKYDVGDLVAVGWNGKWKKPFVGVITHARPEWEFYEIMIIGTGTQTMATGDDLKPIS